MAISVVAIPLQAAPTDGVDFTLREKIAEYLARNIGLVEFKDWFWPLAAATHPPTDMVSSVELVLAELAAGHIDENAVRERLVPFIGTPFELRGLHGDRIQAFTGSAVSPLQVVQNISFPTMVPSQADKGFVKVSS
jgi:hypothetical protein